ncbi:MAG TPA: hypothetical protein VFW19_03865 [Allosphingosinicella sp.]|nr:hypothetical protein [Allosphingosinicella sp.]
MRRGAALTFVDPLAGEIGDFPLATLIERVEAADPDYWNAGAGGGLLYRGPVARDCTMAIYLVPGHGFHLVCDTDGEALAATLRGDSDGRAARTINVGGDPMRISLRQCLPIHAAAAAILYFAERGRRTPDHEWLPRD